MCPQLSVSERRQHEGIEYLGIVCASVLLDRPLASYYVTNITDGGIPFTAVIEMTTLVDPAELQDNTLVYLPRYAAADDDAWSWTDDKIREQFLAALARMYPDFHSDHVRAFRISRVKHVMALPTLGYSERLPPMATSIPNVYAVNSAHIVKGTLNVNEVVELADDAFQRVLAPALRSVADKHFPTVPESNFDVEAARELVARS
jgi:protoporphyrinogen oxidase